jgi:signal transduction histidine kinase
MLPKTLIKGFDKGRLRNLLLLFFLALAIPTAILIGQAYSQLKWEAFHQYRGLAEELTTRIDARLINLISDADSRAFTDYSFLVVAGDPSLNFVQRSALSGYPVADNLPGVLGYFQVDSDGEFSTPVLPPEESDPQKLGIGSEEYSDRLSLARDLQAVLADNRLVQSRPAKKNKLAPKPIAAPASSVAEEDKESVDVLRMRTDSGQVAAEPELFAEEQMADEIYSRDNFDLSGEGSFEPASQEGFDLLNQPRKDMPASPGLAGTLERDRDAAENEFEGRLQNTGGKVASIKLDVPYQKKIESLEKSSGMPTAVSVSDSNIPARAKRLEQSNLPETTGFSSAQTLTSTSVPSDIRIDTFESEIDPLEFSLLDSGHFVLFRKVWRDGQRYIQGVVINQRAFVDDIIVSAFMETTLSGMSNLILAYQDDIIRSISARDASRYSSGNKVMDGDLLYRSRLTTPLDRLELIFSIKRMPPGPGAGVLGWVTLILAIVFVGGFLTLYRLGLSQINLARQQQDFVSAVSHELKTPLTSIRMYGEMLKEGWADEDKRQSYYEFIHDEAERLTRLISNVLQLARITRNEPRFDLQPVRVSDLMSQIESKIGSQVQRAGFKLRFERDAQADPVSIKVDQDCFAQIIINLVDNAIKFSKDAENKCIEIASSITSGNNVVFAIRDYGPGIPKDQMKKIFALFYRSESELTRETVGTGIGLAIVHQLMIAMNGKVDVINREPGAEFRLSFKKS